MTTEDELQQVRKQATDLFLANQEKERVGHDREHDKAIETHEKQHQLEEKARQVALEAEQRRLEAHREAHAAAHASHEKLHDVALESHMAQHASEAKAVVTAQAAIDKRLEGMNQFRDQLRDQATTFVSREVVAALDAQVDRRFEQIRSDLDTERAERKEQYTLGVGQKQGIQQSTAVIIGAISLIGAVLGIIIVLSNVLSARPDPAAVDRAAIVGSVEASRSDGVQHMVLTERSLM